MKFSDSELERIILSQNRKIEILEQCLMDEGVDPKSLYEQHKAFLNFLRDTF